MNWIEKVLSRHMRDGHFIEKCRGCNVVTAQCDCKEPGKKTTYGLCADCIAKKRGEKP